MNKILKPIFRSTNISPFKEFIRLKGHSKWQNIKHTKSKMDSEKSAMIMRYLRQMRAAIAADGEANPKKNLKLAYWIDEAKRKQVPNGTITTFLERYQREKIKEHNVWVNVLGPDSSFLIFHLVTERLHETKSLVNNHIRKCMCKLADGGVKSVFNIEGHILVKKSVDIDEATDIAIEIGAEEVLEVEQDGEVYIKFICNPAHVMVVKNNLLKKNLDVISAVEEYIPHSLVEVNDEGVENVSKLIDRVKAMPEFVQVYDNIA
ncbi:translational activator of cytochrome c oxidase 1 [Leptopilina heterotoma]|uniref:translational activator of cytochrome c oxidase 1 n=1 Tax=Leptopilina heterotoma TaxID=63436 RepID=UPI001CA839EA|nr:translational activator of cytochrome c oxidase 1 [Leptopilina heterotoma]